MAYSSFVAVSFGNLATAAQGSIREGVGHLLSDQDARMGYVCSQAVQKALSHNSTIPPDMLLQVVHQASGQQAQGTLAPLLFSHWLQLRNILCNAAMLMPGFACIQAQTLHLTQAMLDYMISMMSPKSIADTLLSQQEELQQVFDHTMAEFFQETYTKLTMGGKSDHERLDVSTSSDMQWESASGMQATRRNESDCGYHYEDNSASGQQDWMPGLSCSHPTADLGMMCRSRSGNIHSPEMDIAMTGEEGCISEEVDSSMVGMQCCSAQQMGTSSSSVVDMAADSAIDSCGSSSSSVVDMAADSAIDSCGSSSSCVVDMTTKYWWIRPLSCPPYDKFLSEK
jgi:hypothetical protein